MYRVYINMEDLYIPHVTPIRADQVRAGDFLRGNAADLEVKSVSINGGSVTYWLSPAMSPITLDRSETVYRVEKSNA